MKNVSRRDMLKLMGVSAGALAANSVLGSMPAFAGNRSKELNILCWEGYNSAEVLDPFRALSRATIKAESLTNDPTMINRLRGGETKVWDLINVNNPWARKIMAPAGLIKPLPRAEFEPYFDAMLPQFKSPYKWAMSEDGKDLLGMAQRFGPFNYVVNTKKISRATAEDIGWDLFNDPALSGKYGIQESDDWNVFDIFLIAGINPFVVHTEAEMAKFEQTAIKVFKGAKMVGDVASLNQAMVAGEIDFYMTGGTYTASPARADGFSEIRWSTTPMSRRWPMSSSSTCRIPKSPTRWPSLRAPSTQSAKWATPSASSSLAARSSTFCSGIASMKRCRAVSSTTSSMNTTRRWK